MKKHLPPGLSSGRKALEHVFRGTTRLRHAYVASSRARDGGGVGGREIFAGVSDALKPRVTGASVRHYSATSAFPPDASGAMFRVLSGAGSQLLRLSGALLECAYSSPSQASVKFRHTLRGLPADCQGGRGWTRPRGAVTVPLVHHWTAAHRVALFSAANWADDWLNDAVRTRRLLGYNGEGSTMRLSTVTKASCVSRLYSRWSSSGLPPEQKPAAPVGDGSTQFEGPAFWLGQ